MWRLGHEQALALLPTPPLLPAFPSSLLAPRTAAMDRYSMEELIQLGQGRGQQ